MSKGSWTSGQEDRSQGGWDFPPSLEPRESFGFYLLFSTSFYLLFSTSL